MRRTPPAAFIRKIKPDGKPLWTRQLGSSGNDYAYGVAIDKLGRVASAGQTMVTFPGQTNKVGWDAFVRTYRQ
jgi:hypothetical protein